MKIYPKISLFLLLFSLSSVSAKEVSTKKAVKGTEVVQGTDFIRVDRDAKADRLQTGVTRYEKNGVTVDLIGAIHIADAKYYQELNKEFQQYDSLLYEMVGGGGGDHQKGKSEKSGDNAEKPKDPMLSMLGNVYGMVSQFLKLQGQKEGVNYKAKNFVHADLSMSEFEKLQSEKGESLLGFAMKNMSETMKNQAEVNPDSNEVGKSKKGEINSEKLLQALLSGDANSLKREIVGTLGKSDDQVSGFLGNSVIIGDRNKKCLKVLDARVKAGDRKLGIFYGAAHMRDMEARVLKLGYKKVSHRWLTAWDIPR